jgi:hypothetical protein
MKIIAFLINLLAFTIAFGQNDSNKNSILLEKVTIISPENKSQYVGYVLIEGKQIKRVSKKKPRIKPHTKVFNFSGKYIIPGLIDSHVHVSGVNGLTDEDIINNPKLVEEFKNQLPKSYLYFGYTTLIDLSTPNLESLEMFESKKVRPNLYHVGSGAVIGKGYGLTNWNDSLPNFIALKKDNKDHTVNSVVQRIKKTGAIGVKTYYEPGFDPNVERMPVPTPKIMSDLLKETKLNNMLLLVHANSIESHEFLSNYKIDVLTHGLWRWGSYSIINNIIPKEISRVLDKEIQNKIAYTPTLQVINRLKAMAEINYLEDEQLKYVLPNSVIQWYKANQDKLYLDVFGDAPKDVILNSFNRINKQGQFSLNYLHKNGGIILFGTDTPSSLTYGNPPGYNGFLEMKQMYTSGMSLKDILKAATITNATIFNLDKKYGTIESKKVANLVILNKNPLNTIEAYNSIHSIIINGKLINREKLKAN